MVVVLRVRDIESHSAGLGLLRETLIAIVSHSVGLKTLRQSLFYLIFVGEDSREADEVEKELEHTLLLNTMDKEMHELNKQLE